MGEPMHADDPCTRLHADSARPQSQAHKEIVVWQWWARGYLLLLSEWTPRKYSNTQKHSPTPNTQLAHCPALALSQHSAHMLPDRTLTVMCDYSECGESLVYLLLNYVSSV